MNRMLLILPAAAAMILPSASFAQTQSQAITITGSVSPACNVGAPEQSTVSIGALTGSDGKLRPELSGAAIVAETSINNAWCNTPNRITLTSSPLVLVTQPGYASPAGFARSVAFEAALTGWSGAVANKALTPNATVQADTETAYVAAPLGVIISKLSPVRDGVVAEGSYIEAGAYSATVSITLAAR